MNLILLEADDFSRPGRICLRGRRLEHVRSVHRAEVGDRMRVGMLGGRMGQGVVARLDDEALEMDVELDLEPPPKLPLVLVLALPRPKVLRRVLQASAAMGVARVLLIHAARVEKSFWGSPALAPESLGEDLRLGLEQGRDTVLPEVTLHPLFRPVVEDALPALVAGRTALVAHPHAAAECPRGVAGEVVLAIGPEGGFVPFEVELLEAQGFRAVSLGPRILRVEHALPALLARLF